MNVQPSGQYTATLVFQASPITDIGLLEVDGDDVIFHVNVPSPATNRFTLHFVCWRHDPSGRH